MYGNCLVTAAPQGRKRFGSEPCPAAEGPIDKETLRAVESQTCGTVRESDRNYRPFGEPEGVKTQVIKKEESACALTVGREAAEVLFEIDSKLMWRLSGVAKYLLSLGNFDVNLAKSPVYPGMGLFHRKP